MTEQRPRSVAVVVVHGVADQEPKQSARQIANLLSDFTSGSYPGGFTEQEIRVPLEPVLDASYKTPRRGFLANAFSLHERSGTTSRVSADPSLDFMYEQLRDYEPGEAHVFETICLEGKRNDGMTVHVYEAYWADLSRVGNTLTAFFGELYQLLLHLPSLGRTVVNAEWIQRRTWPWAVFAFCQRWLVRLLTLGIAPLNLTVLAFVLPLIATQGEARTSSAIVNFAAITIVVVALVAIAGLVLRRLRLPWLVWLLAPFAAGWLGCRLARIAIATSSPLQMLIFEAWAIAALLIAWVLRIYNSRRPGALGYGGLMLLGSGAYFVRELAIAKPPALYPQAVLRAVEIVNLVLAIVWRVHVAWLAITAATALIAIASVRTWRAMRVAWIGIVTVSLATTAFGLLTLAGWMALFKSITRLKLIPAAAPYASAFHFQWADALCVADLTTTLTTVGAWVEHAVVESASRGVVAFTLMLLAFFLVLVWSIFPSVIAEARSPVPATKPKAMVALGRWLSHGFQTIPLAALLFPLALILMIAACRAGRSQLPISVSAAGGMVLALIAARNWLPGASSALDVALDVDNYLREHPRSGTPRARIAERYLSLLRYIHHAPREYDHTVIIAHSQGSVITADLLRFMNQPKLQPFTKNPVHFFTMGSPLRQLYARAFSPLYEWMDPDATTAQSTMTIGPQAKPDPDDLGVVRWVNAFRTGDYVGRHLWCNRTGDAVYAYRTDSDPPGRRRESCIGEGAHTHYWDRNGQEIAWTLDKLI
jgi:hypothetical protein